MNSVQTWPTEASRIQSQDLENSLEARTPPSSIESQANGAEEPSRERLIAEVAYRRAEARGFVPGHELDDWLEAEREFDAAGASSRD